MANIIQRIIQLVLDKESAKKLQDDTEVAQGAIEKSWKDMAGRVAGYLGAAFLIKKIVDFGKESVAQAAQSQAAWSSLQNTIDNTGASFTKLEGRLRATADAFQDATIHDDDAFASSLDHIIALTGDVNASLNNMGLVANVAAKFFRGDLEPATVLVAKAMNGNVIALQKMGIHAKNAQDALDILAKRSMGAAAREVETFSGQIKRLGNEYDDMQKELGKAIITTDGSVDGIQVLRAAVKTLSEWIVKNKDDISHWVTEGVKFAIDAADVFIRAVTGMANIVGGGFATALGVAAKGIGLLVEGIADLNDITISRQGKNADAALVARTKAYHESAAALKDWADQAINLGSERVKAGLNVLSTPLFSSKDFTGPRKPVAVPGEGNKPMVGSNMEGEDEKKVQLAIKEYGEAAKAAANMQKILGDKFDATGADVERTTKLLNVLASFGIDPATKGFAGLQDHLAELTNVTVPMTTAAKELGISLRNDVAEGAITATTSLNPLADHMDNLKKQQGDVLKAIQTLVTAGFDPASEAVQNYVSQYQALDGMIKQADIAATMTDLSKSLGTDLYQAALDGADSLARLQSEHDDLKKAIQELLAKGVSKEDEAFKKLVVRYDQVTAAIKQQTLAMQLQAAMADFLADALGTALQGGLHEAATQKAKQNAIESAEMLVRAGAFALFGDWPHAQGALALAGQFAAVATAWGALALASHGGGGGGVAPSIPSSSVDTGGAGSALTSGRDSSSNSAANAKEPTADVSLYLVGPGFDMLNPKVQNVVYGANKLAKERFGENARVRLVTSEG